MRMKPYEQMPSDLLAMLERALCLLDGPFLLGYSDADHIWLEAARVDLRAGVELLRRDPCETDALSCAAELTAKAGICLASLPSAHRDASIHEASRLIAAVHAGLAERRTRHLVADAVFAQ
jgi:hypothetical protein